MKFIKKKVMVFFGGHGKRGEFVGFYENKLHSGYCNILCRRVSEPDWDGDVEHSSEEEDILLP